MQRLIYAVLALALAGGSAYLYLKNVAAANRDAAAGPSAPRERIDRANKIARDLEQQAQKRADDAAKRSE